MAPPQTAMRAPAMTQQDGCTSSPHGLPRQRQQGGHALGWGWHANMAPLTAGAMGKDTQAGKALCVLVPQSARELDGAVKDPWSGQLPP